MIVTVVGSGNIAHALIACMNIDKNDTVYMLTSQSNYKWNGIKAYCGNKTKEGKIDIVTSDAQKIIPQSDIMLLTVPAFARKEILKKINRYIADDTLIGSFPGIGGFDDEAKEFISNKNINFFASQRAPYIARIKEKGKTVQVTPKDEIFVAIEKEDQKVKELLERLIGMEVILLDDFLEVNLSNSNPILHSARLYSLLLENETFDKPIYFYREWDDESSKVLLEMDNEFMQIVKALDLTNIKSLEEHYGVKGVSEMTQKIKSISAFKDILTPMTHTEQGYMTDANSRYFTEDVGVGLKYIKEYARKLNIGTPTIDIVYNRLMELLNDR